jgi:tetratricopeptide (TPR) repeat protein
MWTSSGTATRAIGTPSLRYPRRACTALLCATLFCAVQQGADVAPPGSRGPTDSPSTAAPAPPISKETRGDIFMARKMYRDAIDMYRQSASSPVVTNKIGMAFNELSQLQVAKKYYEEAIRMDRTYAEAINNLGTVYYAERSYRRAIIYFKRSLKYSGPVASLYANLGVAYFSRHNYKEAAACYERALKLDPDVLERRSQYGTLIQERAVTDMALFHLYLAKAYAKAGSNERALSYLRKALEEGIKDRKKLADLPEFVTLRSTPEFLDLLASDPKPL